MFFSRLPLFITSTKEDRFSSAFVCLLFGRITRKNHITHFQDILWRGGAWAREDPITLCSRFINGWMQDLFSVFNIVILRMCVFCVFYFFNNHPVIKKEEIWDIWRTGSSVWNVVQREFRGTVGPWPRFGCKNQLLQLHGYWWLNWTEVTVWGP